MVSGLTIFYIIAVVLVVIVLFIVGLFTKLSGTYMIILIFVLVAIVAFTSAVYVTAAATDTGSKDSDAANKSAHGWYTTASVIAWITIGIVVIGIVLMIIGAIFLFGSGAGEAAIAEDAAASLGKKFAQKAASQALQWAQKNGSKELLNSIKHDESHGLFDRLNKHKAIKYIVLFIIYGTIALAFFIGLFAAIGAIAQSGSEQQKGLGKATVSAVMAIFVSISIIVFILVMYLREKKKVKALEEDVQKAIDQQNQANAQTYAQSYAQAYQSYPQRVS